jgi:hypothetical protein
MELWEIPNGRERSSLENNAGVDARNGNGTQIEKATELIGSFSVYHIVIVGMSNSERNSSKGFPDLCGNASWSVLFVVSQRVKRCES